jgi:hypothetical protein
MDFDKEVNCQTCKHGYYKDISPDGWHNWCGANTCYLCSMQYGYCDEYEKGDIPDGKERV